MSTVLATEPAVVTYREAVRRAIRDAMLRDERVFLMGEDVGRYGGSFGVSRGLLEEFGEARILDTPLSEAAFVGAGIGAAIAGMRPIVEIMTVNFSLLALDQILNNAATLLHMSGGQVSVPIVIRMTTGGGRQLAAQHSHSLEGWYAHIPGLKVLAPATVEDAYGMLAPALADPDPVLIFEHGSLYNVQGELSTTSAPSNPEPTADSEPATDAESAATAESPADAKSRAASGPGGFDMESASVRRSGRDVALITYGGMLPRTLEAAQVLSAAGVDAEVIDLRSLRPLDTETVLGSVRRTRRAVVVDEGWRSGSLSAEIAARIGEGAFYDLDAPVGRVCSAEVPLPYARHLENAALPQVDSIVAAAQAVMRGGP
jgi:pyruvate dehydrogenase E1 component beta subunit